MSVSRAELIRVMDDIRHGINLDRNFKRLYEILEVLKNDENIYLVNVFKIVFQTSKDSMLEDQTARGLLPFQHFSEVFLNSFRDKMG